VPVDGDGLGADGKGDVGPGQGVGDGELRAGVEANGVFAAGGAVYLGSARALGLRELEALLLLRAQRSEPSSER